MNFIAMALKVYRQPIFGLGVVNLHAPATATALSFIDEELPYQSFKTNFFNTERAN